MRHVRRKREDGLSGGGRQEMRGERLSMVLVLFFVFIYKICKIGFIVLGF